MTIVASSKFGQDEKKGRAASRVIKLGGSLLDWPEWPAALRRWRRNQPPMRDLLIVGGGAWADLIREADQRHGLGAEASHWLCLRLMSVTARLASQLLPEADFLETWPTEGLHGSLKVVDALPLIEDAERRATPRGLPHSWDVTSDSIAAWLAAGLGAAELVLLKSQLPPGANCRNAAERGYVDRFFPIAAQDVPLVRCVDLRDAQLPEATLAP